MMMMPAINNTMDLLLSTSQSISSNNDYYDTDSPSRPGSDPTLSRQTATVTVSSDVTLQGLRTALMIRWLLYVIIVVLSLMGNGLIVWAIATSEKLRVKSYALVTSMAVTDLLVAFALINQLVHDFWLLKTCDLAPYTSIVRPLERLVFYAAFLHIGAIAVDRYIAVTYPLHYETRMTSLTYGFMIAVAWTCAAAISLPPYLSLIGVVPPGAGQSSTPCVATMWPVTEGYVEEVMYLSNSLFAIVVYVRIWITAMQHEKRQREQQLQQQRTVTESLALSSVEGKAEVSTSQPAATKSGCDGDNATNSSSAQVVAGEKSPSKTRKYSKLRRLFPKVGAHHRATRTILALLAFYVVSWLPYFFSRILVIVGWPSAQAIWAITGIIGISNLSLNVLVYIKTNRDFREAIKRILRIESNKVHANDSVR